MTLGELTQNSRGEFFIVTEKTEGSFTTYRLNDNNGVESITCLRCGLTSYHPKDVESGYCGRCHVFHEDVQPITIGTERWTPLDEMPLTEGQKLMLISDYHARAAQREEEQRAWIRDCRRLRKWRAANERWKRTH
jgi:hypothetical protein